MFEYSAKMFEDSSEIFEDSAKMFENMIYYMLLVLMYYNDSKIKPWMVVVTV